MTPSGKFHCWQVSELVKSEVDLRRVTVKCEDAVSVKQTRKRTENDCTKVKTFKLSCLPMMIKPAGLEAGPL